MTWRCDRVAVEDPHPGPLPEGEGDMRRQRGRIPVGEGELSKPDSAATIASYWASRFSSPSRFRFSRRMTSSAVRTKRSNFARRFCGSGVRSASSDLLAVLFVLRMFFDGLDELVAPLGEQFDRARIQHVRELGPAFFEVVGNGVAQSASTPAGRSIAAATAATAGRAAVAAGRRRCGRCR